MSKKKRYHKSLHQAAYDRLTGMQHFGESKKAAILDGTEKDKIFSVSTYESYWKHIKYFLKWIQENYPECTSLKASKRHVNEWLQARSEQKDEKGNYLSAWTIQLEEAALNKLYGISKYDKNRFQAPRKRHRSEIKRSRGPAKRDKNFNERNNWEIVQFCRGTGCRRNVLERLEGRDLWPRERMENEARNLTERLKNGKYLSENEKKHLAVLNDALAEFPDDMYFIHHRKDKGGRYRMAPVIGPNMVEIVERMRNTAPHERVWKNVNSNMDVHSYRADYAGTLYKMYARDIKDIPYDKYHSGIHQWYQSDVYTCRKDEPGKKLDKRAMKKASKALGHARVDVVAIFYIRNI